MNTSIYKLTSAKIPGGAIYIRYRGGLLRGLDTADAQPTAEQLEYFLHLLPVREAQLASGEVSLGNMSIIPLPERTTKDKIAHYCAAFQEYRNVSYRPTQNEASNIRTVPVSQELLAIFFETPLLLDFSIRNYIQRINITRDIQKNGRNAKERFPNQFDKDFFQKLPSEKHGAYYAHLRAQGLEFIKGRGWVVPDRL
ncbi:hypothetical protein QMK33_00375 [Hymenobacter sp. H14-R3]|uniref:hypothetical protein n=1 Tax=Hymenobacter sp. H14-R3 TaxID=3046308 RepID=UPI0024BBDBCB|nr:hypothetical protein [Hymenobacter sp. H14-R3]MDJ0363589.1 hypothetical protein [Hymenobacter sp. H14-R3]